MDPYVELDNWANFHSALVIALRDALTPRVRPAYVVQAEQRVYIEHLNQAPPSRAIQPDVSVLRERHKIGPGARSEGSTEPPVASPYKLTLPIPVEAQETFLTVRSRSTMEVVTVVEVLSPANKRPNSDGRREYLSKREIVLRGAAHLVEIDLLRGGLRLPTVEGLPTGDYYIFVSREERRPEVDVYAWALNARLPVFPVPLSRPDDDVQLDLQRIFDELYDRSGYDYVLRYDIALDPPVSDAQAAWVQAIVSND